MKNYEQFKRLIMFVIGIVIISLLVLTFAFVWYTQYNDSIVMPFVNRGNWLVIAIYLVLLVLFQRIYNGYRIGYLKRSDVIYSQTLSVLITNVITYFQVSLIGRGLVTPVPFILMTLVCGLFIEKFENFFLHLLGMILGTAIAYIFGTAWFCVSTGTGVVAALALCVFPFLIGDLVKMVLAGLVAPGVAKQIKKIG